MTIGELPMLLRANASLVFLFLSLSLSHFLVCLSFGSGLLLEPSRKAPIVAPQSVSLQFGLPSWKRRVAIKEGCFLRFCDASRLKSATCVSVLRFNLASDTTSTIAYLQTNCNAEIYEGMCLAADQQWMQPIQSWLDKSF